MTRKRAITLLVLGIVALFASALACGGAQQPRSAAVERGRSARAPTLSREAYAEADLEYAAGPAAGPAPQSLSGSPLSSNAGLARAQPMPEAFNTEQYDHSEETGFRLASEQPLSTFSVDVDTASYSNVRRMLAAGRKPPIDAVRVEELVNYFSYEDPAATHDAPIAVSSELAQNPFDPRLALLRVALRASAARTDDVPAKRLVFLVDVSGSMESEDKLPLLKAALSLLVRQLEARDEVAIVTYAGASGVALEPTRGDQHEAILHAIERMEAGGSTNGGAGIEQAYALARQTCTRGCNCRVILATDGDFNVGIADRGSLVRLVQRERDAGIFLTVLGFGMGNLKDATMEELADKGDGSYAYIDTLREARKVLIEQVNATLQTVAKDTKIQIEWNPARVERYRLIGYENRRLHDEDFNDDAKDAGEMGDGQSVTALYELELGRDGQRTAPQLDPLRYQGPRASSVAAHGGELAAIKVRWKSPEGGQSRLVHAIVRGEVQAFERASADLRFASAVAGFGMVLRDSTYAKGFGFGDVDRIARGALGADRDGYRHEFLELVARARELVTRD